MSEKQITLTVTAQQELQLRQALGLLLTGEDEVRHAMQDVWRIARNELNHAFGLIEFRGPQLGPYEAFAQQLMAAARATKEAIEARDQCRRSMEDAIRQRDEAVRERDEARRQRTAAVNRATAAEQRLAALADLVLQRAGGIEPAAKRLLEAARSARDTLDPTSSAEAAVVAWRQTHCTPRGEHHEGIAAECPLCRTGSAGTPA